MSSWDTYWNNYRSETPSTPTADEMKSWEGGEFTALEYSLAMTYERFVEAASVANVNVVNNDFALGDCKNGQKIKNEMVERLEDLGVQVIKTPGTPGETEMGEIFSQLKDELIRLVDAGSKVVDIIGYGNDYNFDFVNDINKLTLTVNGTALPKTELVDPQFSDPYVTSAYGFGDDQTGYDFILLYYADGQDGKSDECFVWEINVPVTKDTPVQLTYSVKLTNPQSASGTYGQYDADGSEKYSGLYTNASATLYPVDSNGNQGIAENFAKPTVSTPSAVVVAPVVAAVR